MGKVVALDDDLQAQAALRSRVVERARRSMPLSAALLVLRLSAARYHTWVRAEEACTLDDRPSCPRSFPQRLTFGEVEAIGDLVQSEEHRHMPLRTLALHAQRIGQVFAHPATWGKLIRERGSRRPRLRGDGGDGGSGALGVAGTNTNCLGRTCSPPICAPSGIGLELVESRLEEIRFLHRNSSVEHRAALADRAILCERAGVTVAAADVEEIRAELADQLYRLAIPMGLLNIGAAGVLGGGVYLATERTSALVWFGMVAAVGLLTRIPLVRWYRARVGSAPAGAWMNRFTAHGLLFGAAWGSGAYLLWIDDSAILFAIMLVFGSVYLGAVMAMAPHVPAWVAFSVAMSGPIILRCLTQESVTLRVYGGTTVLFFLASWILVRRMNTMIRSSVEMRFENRRLVDDLREEKRVSDEANAAKTILLAAASHDLRQPLHAVRLFVGALENAREEAVRSRLLRSLESATAALSGLLDTLLDLSRADAGVVKPLRTVFPLQELFDSLELEFADAARSSGLRLRVAPSSAWIESDRELLSTIVRNFISNAIRYTQNGGVLVGGRRKQGQIAISVWDTGAGIDQGDRDRVFNDFVQLGNPERNRERGLGLGLAVARRFGDLLDHRIELRSTVGVGSCFSVTVARASPLEESVDETSPSDSLLGRRVLVVDDDRFVCTACVQLLEQWGAIAVPAHTADQALAAVREGPMPDLLIVDLRLPENVSGMDFISRARAVAGAELAALVVTGDTSPAVLLDAYRQALPLLHKPVPPAQLKRAAETLCERRSLD